MGKLNEYAAEGIESHVVRCTLIGDMRLQERLV
jgi:hypothetical protein